ncbi:MAG: hypothetical protein ACF8Q5_03235 [Phycisphaerales bacterium JB040]
MGARPDERYTVRRKILKLFGAAFHVYDQQGQVVAYCKQKAFRLREDIRLYTDESLATPLVVLRTQQVIDFGATYDVTLPGGERLGSFRRKGMKSSFLRDEWLVFDEDGAPLATLTERGSFTPIVRRYIEALAPFFPQSYDLVHSASGARIASIRQHFNWFVYRLGVTVHSEDARLDDLMLLSAAALIAAIEGRQN